MLELASGRAPLCELSTATDDRYLSATLMSMQAYALFCAQHFDAAQRWARHARALFCEQGSLYGATHASAVLCAALGNLARYSECLEHSEWMVERFEADRGVAWATAAIALAQVRYEQNRLADATALCDEALPRLSVAASVHAFAAGHILRARLCASADRREDAWRILDAVHAQLDPARSTPLLAQLAFEKMRLCAHLNQASVIETLALEFDLDATEAACEQLATEPARIDARLASLGCAQALRLLMRGDSARALSLLEALAASARLHGFAQRLTMLEAWRALIHERENRMPEAHEALLRAWSYTSAQGFTRSVFDDVPDLPRLLTHALRASLLSASAAYLERYRDLLGPIAAPRTTPRSTAMLDALTEREMTVLKLLAQGLSNQEICVSSNIAITTAKWHLKNIFSKLGVGTRTAALARARALHLID